MAAKRGPKKKRKYSDDTPSKRATRGRAEYVDQCIRDQPWLDGKTAQLVKLLIDRFGGGESQARRAVALAYQWMDEEREKNVERMRNYLDRVHRHTIEMGQRQGDGRVVTPAAAELRKMYGIGEPDRVNVTGSVQSGLSSDAAALLGALKLTNAQRLAEIDKLEAEISAAEQPTAVVQRDIATATTEDQEDGQESSDDDSDD